MIFLMDFDGVILDSNNIKIEAYKEIVSKYGNEVKTIFIKHHIDNPGISRYVKFENLFKNILKINYTQSEIDKLAEEFSSLVFDKVTKSPFIPGVEKFLEKYYQNNLLYVISGTPEDELRLIVERRGLSKYFKGVYGSPKKKVRLINELLKTLDKDETYFVGDGSTDYEAAKQTKLPFIGILNEHNKEMFCKLKNDDNNIIVEDFNELLDVYGLRIDELVRKSLIL